MKIVGLLCWYDENPAHLAGAVASLGAFASHVVAVDGAYALYPQGKAASPTCQADVVRDVAARMGMGCTVHVPQHPWPGNEVEKRDFMFRVAETVTDADDWYFVLDGDEVVTDVPSDLPERAARAVFNAAEATLWQHRGHNEPQSRPFHTPLIEQQPLRIMFRALRGMKVAGKHYRYIAPHPTPDHRAERVLWGDLGEMVPAEQWLDVKVEHRSAARDPQRNAERDRYYELRNRLKTEVFDHAND